MNRANVSFTFLDRVTEVEFNIQDGRWQSALALALTLPDICGGIAFPDIVKRYRDGRIMLDRQKNPTRDVGAQYIRWFDEYASDFFKISSEDETPYICGERCWQLRCEYLHQNKGFFNDENSSQIHFHLGINCGTSVCQLDRQEIRNGSTDVRIDIEQFCIRMSRAARSYYEAAHKEKDFSLYNTPVLDFIQTGQGTRTNPVMTIWCADPTYAKGLSMAVKSVSAQTPIFSSIEEARKKLGKRNPVVWIVMDEVIKENEQEWKKSRKRPIILLTGKPQKYFQSEQDKLTVLTLPIKPEELRTAIRQYLQ